MKFIYKRKFAGLVLALGFLFFGSCKKDLDKTPESQLSDADFWKTTDDFKNACNYFYGYLPDIFDNITSNWTDEGFASGGSNNISDGSRLVTATSGDWDNNYKLIFNCNNLLEKSLKFTGDQNTISRYKGEAKFFRALAYFNLIQRFGDVPHILRTYDVKDTLNQAHRTPRQVVLDTIYKDLDFAVANLPKAGVLAAAEYGRITWGAALSFKARVALYYGTLKKYHSLGDPNKDLNIAIAASTEIMDSKEYDFYNYAAVPDSTYWYLFQPKAEGRANKENILVRLYGVDDATPISFTNYSAELVGGNNTTPTKAFMDAFLYKDGLPPEKSPFYHTPTSTLSEFENRDPRLGMTVFNKNDYFYTAMYTPNFASAPTGYKVFKYYNNAQMIGKKSYTDNIIIRYPEVLLINAEAKFELNGSIADDDLNKTINLIRARVKMPSLTNAFVTANGLDMKNEIRRERRTELGLEGERRYWDLIRWKTAEIELPKTILGIRYFPNEYVEAQPVRVNADNFVIVQDQAQRRFNPLRDYLWPLPTRDLGLNLNMKQNPKW
jgi:hypothetical protein